MTRLGDLGRDGRGVAAVEFALVAPLLIGLTIGGVDVSKAVLTSLDLTNAASDVAELVAAQSSVDATSISNFCQAAALDMTPLPTGVLKVGIASVTEGASSASVDWQAGCNGQTGLAGAAKLARGVIPDPGDSVIVVQATYQLTLPVPLILPSTVSLTQTALYKPRNNTTVPFT